MSGDRPAAVRQLLRGAQLLTLRLLAEFYHDAFMSGVSEAVGGPGPGPPLVMTVVPRQLGAQLRQLVTRLWPGGRLAKLGGAAAAAALVWWWYSGHARAPPTRVPPPQLGGRKKRTRQVSFSYCIILNVRIYYTYFKRKTRIFNS